MNWIKTGKTTGPDGTVIFYEDTFRQDDGCYFEANGDMDGILAWMPLPKPLKDGELAL